jgi:hypothetical protein
MKRDEAVTLLREINNNCHNLSPDSVSLVKSRPEDQLSVGYQLHIEMAVDSETEHQLRFITSKHGLSIHQEKGQRIIIYKSKPTVQL